MGFFFRTHGFREPIDPYFGGFAEEAQQETQLRGGRRVASGDTPGILPLVYSLGTIEGEALLPSFFLHSIQFELAGHSSRLFLDQEFYRDFFLFLSLEFKFKSLTLLRLLVALGCYMVVSLLMNLIDLNAIGVLGVDELQHLSF